MPFDEFVDLSNGVGRAAKTDARASLREYQQSTN